ncbi:septum formation family protein [Micromonospora sp. NPDC000089]|uniref:septum formation family protein n=1 Tax=unclassified Micromonospora TaxID=2617518 RepID=UPI0036870642
MRRWWTAVTIGALTALALSGCGAPVGVDRNLTDDWPALAAPRGFVPTVGACHPGVSDVGYLSGWNPVDCAGPHRAETVHVGTLRGADARPTTPPAAGSPAVRTARADCDRQVRRVVGADWRSGLLALSLVLPSAPAWGGGARWYRCDLVELRSLDEPAANTRTGSLRGALAGNGPLKLGCFNPTVRQDDVEAMVPVACTAKHHAEFAGVWQAPDVSYAAFTRDRTPVHRGCQGVIARYTGVADNSDLPYRAGSIFYHPFEREWRAGNRGVQCFLWVGDRTLTRSLRAAGTRGLPAR